jgi:hypothetical protein
MGDAMAIKVDFDFDKNTYRHTMNGHQVVLHCHHYMSLTTKLAEDFADVGGTQVLAECTEDSIRPIFDSYFADNGVSDPAERLAVGCEFYAVMGLGKMTAEGGTDGGSAELERSHVDEGWTQKWGAHDAPVNHVTRGYLAAMFAAAFDKPARSYAVAETASIVKGDPKSAFSVAAA